VEYVERLFGYSPRWTLEKLRVAEALEGLPGLGHALDAGALSWSAARELTRVALPETESEWLEATAGKTARDIERLVAGHGRGSRPYDAPDARLVRHVIRLEVSADAFALFRDAMAKLRQEAGAPINDDQAVAQLARHVLSGPSDDGCASYQVLVSVCEHCRRGFQCGNGERVEIAPDLVEMAACDALHVGPNHPVDKSTHVGSGGSTQVGARATQTIPPATRRHVLARDGRRCVVPGCRHSAFVDVHHLEGRADGGGHDVSNLVTLCGAHHRAVHRGALSISRQTDGELAFRHADGSNYGAFSVSPNAAAIRTKVFQTLRNLGFREAESKRAVERAAEHIGSDSTESLLRCALRELDRAA
jgi:hypothetical protein